MPTHTRIWDNDGETFDRYTVEFLEDEDTEAFGPYYMAIGDTGNVPNGVCMHVDGVMVGDHLGREIDISEMTEPARRAVLQEERTQY